MRKSRTLFVVWLAVLTALVGAACAGGSKAEPQPSQVIPTPATPAEKTVAFDQFPVLWLGEGYDSDGDGLVDMALRDSDYKHEDPFYSQGKLIRPEIRQFSLAYGDCTPSTGRDTCSVPITIVVNGPGSLPLSNAVKTGQSIEVRRARFEVYGFGELYLHTARFDLIISALGATRADALARAIGIANQLEGANEPGRDITKTTDFDGVSLLNPATAATATPLRTAVPLQTPRYPEPLCSFEYVPDEPMPTCPPLPPGIPSPTYTGPYSVTPQPTVAPPPATLEAPQPTLASQ